MTASEFSFDRWKALMSAFSLGENLVTYDALLEAYAEKHRAYHTAEHINACLKHLDAVQEQADHPHEEENGL